MTEKSWGEASDTGGVGSAQGLREKVPVGPRAPAGPMGTADGLLQGVYLHPRGACTPTCPERRGSPSGTCLGHPGQPPP